jgi:cytochrome c oxidase accessory protein FixG
MCLSCAADALALAEATKGAMNDPTPSKTALQSLADAAMADAAQLAPIARASAATSPEVERVDVAAVNARANRQHYAKRQTIYPKLAHGTFRRIKWAVMAVTLGIYYALPWIRVDRGPSLPHQAFLIDFAHQRLFLGPIEIWAQEFYLVTGLLVLAALGLFLVTSLAGRVWCGYACPQTVWTDLMVAVERFWQGDRNARIRLDQAPWSFDKLWRKAGTHVSWALIGLATGGAFIFYFRDAPTLAGELWNGTAPPVAWTFLGLFAGTTYLLGGLAREQVCTYMCPWPRIQGALFDDDSLLVSYRPHRGEPRAPHKKGASWDGRGDCIDCNSCVAVCPMGIDIRDGPQLECIQCALCIDACDAVMDRIGRPSRLIAYDTFNRLQAAASGNRPPPVRLIRPRTVFYGSLIAVVTALMLSALIARDTVIANVLADRNPLFVRLSNGGIRNGYTVDIANKQHQPLRITLALDGLPGAELGVVGETAADPVIEIKPDALKAIKVFVTVPPAALPHLTAESTPFNLVLTDSAAGSTRRQPINFRRPAP